MRFECIICRWQTHDFTREDYEYNPEKSIRIINYCRDHMKYKHPEFFKNNMGWVMEKFQPIPHSSFQRTNQDE